MEVLWGGERDLLVEGLDLVGLLDPSLPPVDGENLRPLGGDGGGLGLSAWVGL